MHLILDLVSRSGSDGSNTSHNLVTDVVTGTEVLDASDDLVASSSASGNNQNLETGKLNSSLSLIHDFQLALQKYSGLFVKLHYDVATEVITSFLTKHKRQKLEFTDIICHVLTSLAGLEKQYYSFGFVRGKARNRDEGDLLKQYGQMKKLIFELTMEQCQNLKQLGVIRDVLLDLFNSRIMLIKVFTSLLTLDGWEQKEQVLQHLSDIDCCKLRLEEEQYHQCCLSEAVGLIHSEIHILYLLLNLQLTIVSGQYYSSLLNLKAANERIRIWFNTVEYGKLRTKGTSFLRLSISKPPSIYLCNFIGQVYSLLFAKFSLYFYYNLSPYIHKTDFEQALNDVGPPNFNQLFCTFYRKNDVMYIAFLSTTNFGDKKSDRAGKFKVLYCLGGDRKQLMRLLPVALNVIVEKNVSRKVFQIHDGNIIHNCIISLVEGSIYMIIVTNKNRKVNNGKFVTFTTDVSRILTFSKLCQSSISQ